MADFDNPNVQTPRESARRSATTTTSSVLSTPTTYPHTTFVSWRSVLAGFFISLLSFSILLSLGMAIGGSSFQWGQDGSAWTWSSTLWIIGSTIISLFAGSYVAGRISNYMTMRIGAVQGIVIASLFFSLVLYQMGTTLGWVGSRIGSAIGNVGEMATRAMDNPEVQAAGRDLLSNLNLQVPPEQVIRGVVTRLVQGDTAGARDYLARQANVPPEEAQRRIDQAMTVVSQQAEEITEAASRTVAGLGWGLFALLLLGSAAAALGGGMGSRENHRHPLTREEGEFLDLTAHRAAM